MKKNDIASLVLIASISFMIAYFTANSVLGTPKKEDSKVRTAEAINGDVGTPDKRVFNADAIDPTIDRSIGKSADELPLNTGQDN